MFKQLNISIFVHAKIFKTALFILSINSLVFSMNAMEEVSKKSDKTPASSFCIGNITIKNETAMQILCTLSTVVTSEKSFLYCTQFLVSRAQQITLPINEENGIWLKNLDQGGKVRNVPIWGPTTLIANKIVRSYPKECTITFPSSAIKYIDKPGTFSIYETTDGEITIENKSF